MYLSFLDKKEKYNDLKERKKKLITESPYKKYILRYFYNTNNIFFHLFMHTKVYDKITNENIEKHGILLRSWNPITKRGERYVLKKGEQEEEGDLNLKRTHLPNTKTIFEFSSSREDVDEENYYRL